jgi:hypothetical protein
MKTQFTPDIFVRRPKYERAGMHIAHEYVIYEKELRPGDEE